MQRVYETLLLKTWDCVCVAGTATQKGCHRSENCQGQKFFTVQGKSGNFVFSVGKLTVSRKVRETSNNLIWFIYTIEG